MASNELIKQKEELAAKLAALEKQIEDARQEERAEVIGKIQAMMAENGISVADLSGRGGAKRKASSSAGRKLPPKYRDAAGNTWTGRGIQPRWLQDHIAKGKKLEDFAI
ncbi:MAG: H-NS histone family protein [Burkholderiaceae bacterium]